MQRSICNIPCSCFLHFKKPYFWSILFHFLRSHFKKLQFLTIPFHGSNRNLSHGSNPRHGWQSAAKVGRCTWGKFRRFNDVVFWGSKKQGPLVGGGKEPKNNEENGGFDEFKCSDWVAEKMEVCLKKSGEQIVVSLFFVGQATKAFLFQGSTSTLLKIKMVRSRIPRSSRHVKFLPKLVSFFGRILAHILHTISEDPGIP